MADSIEFVEGELLDYTLLSPAGWVTLSAEVTADKGCLILDDFAIWPLHTKQLQLSSGFLFEVRGMLSRQAARQGYTMVQAGGFRLSGRSPRRPFLYRWSLM